MEDAGVAQQSQQPLRARDREPHRLGRALGSAETVRDRRFGARTREHELIAEQRRG